MRLHSVRLALLFALLGVAACSSVSPAGLVAASRLDPLATPADQIGVAVGVPETVRLTSGDAILRIAFRGRGEDGALLIEEAVPLQLVRDGTGRIDAHAPDEVVYLASLRPEDAARFSAAQSAIRDARDSGVDGEGTFGVVVRGGCFTGAAPRTLPTSTWLRTEASGPFVPLTRRVDAFEAMGEAASLGIRGVLSPC